MSIAATDLKQYKLHDIGNVKITNHKGELKGEAKAMKGVLLKDILEKVELTEEQPKRFSEFYFVCEGTDHYKVVYSWNELFNTAVADKVFIVTEKDGKTFLDDEDGMLMISSGDLRTGRRFVKNLQTIHVRRAQ